MSEMKTIGIIPARWKSSRFEGKVLANILGKPMIQHVWERAKEAKTLDELIIATDNDEVIKKAESFGAKVVYTSKDQPSGTDRIAEVVNPIDVSVIVNIQGDEPLIHPSMIDSLSEAILKGDGTSMATLRKRITDKHELFNPNVVKVAVDKDGYALYFSRSPIPYYRRENDAQHSIFDVNAWMSHHTFDIKEAVYYKHIGIYAYTKDFLFTYTNLPESKLEDSEKLEQLRALENGYRIKTIETDYDTIGVDMPDDLKKVEDALRK